MTSLEIVQDWKERSPLDAHQKQTRTLRERNLFARLIEWKFLMPQLIIYS